MKQGERSAFQGLTCKAKKYEILFRSQDAAPASHARRGPRLKGGSACMCRRQTEQRHGGGQVLFIWGHGPEPSCTRKALAKSGLTQSSQAFSSNGRALRARCSWQSGAEPVEHMRRDVNERRSRASSKIRCDATHARGERRTPNHFFHSAFDEDTCVIPLAVSFVPPFDRLSISLNHAFQTRPHRPPGFHRVEVAVIITHTAAATAAAVADTLPSSRRPKPPTTHHTSQERTA